MSASVPLDAPLTQVAGATVLVTDRYGDVDPDTWAGCYHHDARVLSHVSVTLDGRRLPLLSAQRHGPAASLVVQAVPATEDEARVEAGEPDGLLLRRWDVTTGTVRLELEVQAFTRPIRRQTLRVALACDLIAARKGEASRRPAPRPWQDESGTLSTGGDGYRVLVEGDGADRLDRGDTDGDAAVVFTVDAEPGCPWRGAVVVRARAARDEGRSEAVTREPSLRVRSATTKWPASVASALDDVRALAVDVGSPKLRYLAAGAPWYMALFGRDTLLSAWSTLVAGTDASLDVLRSLARYQGTTVDPETLEEPGRILHELRTGRTEVFGVASGRPYYGTVDATPLFVMLLAEAHRWGADDDDVRALLPAARAAVAWCRSHGDFDSDGFVEYDADPGGLANLGWKDSGEAMVHADGSFAEPPIALAEAQAYVWAALQGMAQLESRLGDPGRAPVLRREADRLRVAFHDAFWLQDQQLVAMALDRGKRPLMVPSSNIGHCLWAGILDADTGAAAGRRLCAPELRTAWGIRTLGSSATAYNPLGYHVGAVWPHDTAIGVAGLRRYGQDEAALEVADGLLSAAEGFGWRLPELYGGFDADEVPSPVPYPTACSPQAWAASVPLLLLRTVLGLEPDVPAGVVRLAPCLPDGVTLDVDGVPLGAGTLRVRVTGDHVEEADVPDGITVLP